MRRSNPPLPASLPPPPLPPAPPPPLGALPPPFPPQPELGAAAKGGTQGREAAIFWDGPAGARRPRRARRVQRKPYSERVSPTDMHQRERGGSCAVSPRRVVLAHSRYAARGYMCMMFLDFGGNRMHYLGQSKGPSVSVTKFKKKKAPRSMNGLGASSRWARLFQSDGPKTEDLYRVARKVRRAQRVRSGPRAAGERAIGRGHIIWRCKAAD